MLDLKAAMQPAPCLTALQLEFLVCLCKSKAIKWFSELNENAV